MKRMLSRMLILALCLCMAAPSALAADVTVIPQPETYHSLVSMVSVGDTVYMLTTAGLEAQLLRWTEDMPQAEVVAAGLLNAERFSTREEAEAAIPSLSTDENADAAHAISFIFSDGAQLYGFNGIQDLIFAIDVAENGLTYTDVTVLSTVQGSSYALPISVIRAGEWLLWFETDANSRRYDERLLAYNLTTGTVKQAVLPEMYDVASYKDGKILVLCAPNGEQQKQGAYAVYTYEPATDVSEFIGVLPKGVSIRRIEYSPKLEMLVYQDRTRIMGWHPETGPEQIGFVPTSVFADFAVAGDSMTYTTDALAVESRSIRKGYSTDHSLTMMGGTMYTVLSQFAMSYQDVPVYYVDRQANETYQQVFARVQNFPDLVYVPGNDGDYKELLESGALMDLSSFEDIKAYVDQLYPAFKKLVTRDGGIYGVPVQANSYNGWFINKEVMADMGLTAEDIPTSLTELCAFATKWNNEYAAKYPHYTLLNNTTNYRERLLEAMVENWSYYCQYNGKELTFDDPIFQEMMAALDAAELKNLDDALKQTNPEVSEYKQALIWTGCKVVGNWGSYMEDYSDRIFIPLTLTPETAYVSAVQSVSLWVVNAKSENAEYAAAILAETIEALGEKDAYVLRMDKVDPVMNEHFEDVLAYEEERLASLEARLDESVNRATIEKRIQEQKEYMDTEMLRNMYDITPSSIKNYMEVIAPVSFIYVPDAVHISNRSAEIYGCIKRYISGTMTAEVFIDQMGELIKAN